MEEDVPPIIPDGIELWVQPQHAGGEVKGLFVEFTALFLSQGGTYIIC